jgi:hypothetical protein
MEHNMSIALRWIAAALLAGLAWLVVVYTDEYFRPYKRIRMNGLKK